MGLCLCISLSFVAIVITSFGKVVVKPLSPFSCHHCLIRTILETNLYPVPSVLDPTFLEFIKAVRWFLYWVGANPRGHGRGREGAAEPPPPLCRAAITSSTHPTKNRLIHNNSKNAVKKGQNIQFSCFTSHHRCSRASVSVVQKFCACTFCVQYLPLTTTSLVKPRSTPAEESWKAVKSSWLN